MGKGESREGKKRRKKGFVLDVTWSQMALLKAELCSAKERDEQLLRSTRHKGGKFRGSICFSPNHVLSEDIDFSNLSDCPLLLRVGKSIYFWEALLISLC